MSQSSFTPQRVRHRDIASHAETVIDVCCRLRASVFLLGGGGIRTKMHSASDQYLVPSCDFNDNKDLGIRLAGQLFSGTSHS